MSGLPRRMATMAGSLPSDWYDGLPDPPEVSPDSANKWWASRRNCTNYEDTNALIMVLNKVLVLDPNERSSAVEISHDPCTRF